MNKRVLVRADDLGYSSGVNYGIADALKGGIIKSVGVMVNMPETENGLKLIKDEDVCLGLHTNICVGKPLTNPSEIKSLVGENGEFKASKVYRAAKEDFVDLDEVIKEIEAQYQRFVELTGKKPSYFEGHAIASQNFFKGLKIVAKRHGCNYLGMDMESGIVPFKNSKMKMIMESMESNYRPVDTLKRIVEEETDKDYIPTLICHPGYLDAYILKTSSLLEPRTLEVEMAISKEMLDFIKDNDVTLLTYDEVE